MNPDTNAPVAYEAPAVRVLGTVAELTQNCDKQLGGSDGFTFMGQAIVCRST
ncbi:MAG TPA: lasso RiPP family leader peptide-containing protein [Solirubrobacteraceae bacterium]|jgi:hypothetical protein|nr:lasso RiPP family leader peptide-containing protein [Solirubrobacteraceae bacterium]